MEATKTEVPKSKRRRTGAARRNRARQYKSGDTNNVVKPVGADSRVARFIKQVVEQKSSKKPKDQQALVPVVATAKKGNKSAKVQEAIKSQAFNIVRQKLVASLMQILPQTNEGNWNDGNNQAPMGAWSNNNNNNNNNNNMNNGGWGNNNNNNNNMNMNNGGGFWSNNNNNNNNNNMTRGGPNMQGQGGWNNNTNNNLDRGVMNSQGGRNNNKNNNRVPANSQGAWNSSNNNANNNNIGHAKPNSGGMWSSSSNSNLNFDARNNMPNAWSSNLQRSQLTMNNNNNNSNTSVWDAQCPVAPAPPRWNHNLENSTLRNAGHMNQNQNINLSGGGGGDWNGSGLQSNSMWGGKWTDDPRNAGGREYFQDQQTGGNDNYVNDQQNDDEYNQSSAELKFAIMDMNMPGGKILGRRQQLLKAAFNKALVDVVLNADRRFPPIQIKFSRFIQDIYKISVASRGCVEVLQNLVDRLPALWPGSKLRLVAFQPRVKLQKASLFIRSGAVGRSSEEIFLIIERQNTGLTTDKWHVFHTKERDDGVLLIVGIDKQSFDYLERCEGRVFFLTSNAIFKLFKKPTGAVSNGGTGNNPSPKTKPRNRTKKEKGTMA